MILCKSTQKKQAIFVREFQIAAQNRRFEVQAAILAEKNLVSFARIAGMPAEVGPKPLLAAKP